MNYIKKKGVPIYATAKPLKWLEGGASGKDFTQKAPPKFRFYSYSMYLRRRINLRRVRVFMN